MKLKTNSLMQRRRFIKTTLLTGTFLKFSPQLFHIISRPKLNAEVIGHGDFKYRVEKNWGDLDPKKTPVNNCHEMVQSADGRLFLLTDHPKNNIIIYDKSGKLLGSWTLNYAGAHGLSIHREGGDEYLYITDTGAGKVTKTTLEGKIVLDLKSPNKMGAYEPNAFYRPTETAIGPNGDIYVADGYGSQFIVQYSSKGEFIQKFGGDSFLQKNKFKQAHGVALDTRDLRNPTLLCSARIKNTFKRFSLEGEFIEDIYLPGAFISRPVIDGENLYSGVCFGMTKENYNMQMNLGFVTILDKNNQVVSNPGGTKPKYKKDGKLEMMTQDKPVFKHCHDVCVDSDKNLYVCQWNADKVYPYKLHRV
ncbi:MAG: 6-bladed beta-propeller [Saprospiraceae bacterium]|nr:6-bladed beta-propeller [Saprospiraceae bacterium]